MNTEEINLMMQLVEKIQNNNTNDGLLNPHQLNQVEEFLKEHLSFVDWDGLDKSEVMLGKKMEELYSVKDDSRRQRAEKAREEILNKISAFENKVEDKIKKITYDVKNVPRIKPVDTFSNSDEHRALLSQIDRLESFKSNIHQDIKLVQEWIKATKPKQRDKIKAEFEDSETGMEEYHADKYPQSPNGPGDDEDDYEDDDKREVSLSDVIEPTDHNKELVENEILVDSRTHKLLKTLNVKTFKDLMCFTQKELMSNFNYGRHSMNKLNKELQGLGISLSKGG